MIEPFAYTGKCFSHEQGMLAAFELAGPGNQRDWQIIAKPGGANLENG